MRNLRTFICFSCAVVSLQVAIGQTSSKPMSDFYTPQVKSFLKDHPAQKKGSEDFKKENLAVNNRQLKQVADNKKKNEHIKPHQAIATPAQAKKKFMANDPDLKKRAKDLEKAG